MMENLLMILERYLIVDLEIKVAAANEEVIVFLFPYPFNKASMCILEKNEYALEGIKE